MMKICMMKVCILTIGLLGLASCAKVQCSNNNELNNHRWVKTSSVSFLLPNDLVEEPVVVKDVARWKFHNSSTTLIVESGTELPDYSKLRQSYKDSSDYVEEEMVIDGVQAIFYTFSFESKSESGKLISGLFISRASQRNPINLVFEGNSTETRDLAKKVFCSARFN